MIWKRSESRRARQTELRYEISVRQYARVTLALKRPLAGPVIPERVKMCVHRNLHRNAVGAGFRKAPVAFPAFPINVEITVRRYLDGNTSVVFIGRERYRLNKRYDVKNQLVDITATVKCFPTDAGGHRGPTPASDPS
jgi:hypothetical protein